MYVARSRSTSTHSESFWAASRHPRRFILAATRMLFRIFIRHSIRNSTTPMLLSALSSAVSRIGVSPQASASNTIKNVRFASKNWRSAFRSSFSTCSMFPDAQMIISLKDSGSFTEMGKFHDTDMARSLSKSRMRRPIARCAARRPDHRK